jgi:RNA polymerase sigma-70 factor, ECF subfamily
LFHFIKKTSGWISFTQVWYSMCGSIETMPHGPLNKVNSSRSQPGSRLQDLTDEQIMGAVQQGDGDAFAVLFDRYHRLVLVTAMKIVKDVAEAEEVTQNVFFEIYRVADKFDSAKGTLKVWLLQYAYHRSMNRRNYLLLRHFYNRAQVEDANWSEEMPAGPQLFGQEVARAVKEALATLNETQRRTIEMVFFDGLTLRDVAEKTKESLSNVRNHYYPGLEKLRSCLGVDPGGARLEKRAAFGEVSHAKA